MGHQSARASLTAFTCLVLGSSAGAAQVEDIGSSNSSEFGLADLVSRDGDVIVGRSSTRPFRWRRSTGYAELEQPSQGQAVPTGLSDDGAFACGLTLATLNVEALRWRADGSLEELGSLFPPPAQPGDNTFPQAISGDGSVVVGESSRGFGSARALRAFMWTEANGMVDIHPAAVPSTFRTSATRVNADGSIILGRTFDPDPAGSSGMFVRIAGAGTLLVDAPGLVSARPAGISRDGSTIFGQGNFGGPADELFSWTPAVGVIRLAVLPAGSRVVTASADGSTVVIEPSLYWTSATGLTRIPGPDFAPTDVSEDGSVIIGRLPSSDTVVWDRSSGYVDLLDFGRAAGAYGVNGDATVIVGNLERPDFQRRPVRWTLDGSGIGAGYCSPASPHSASPEGGRIRVFGSNIGGFDNAVLRASNLPPNTFGIFVAGRGQNSVTVQNGTLCVGPQLLRFVGPGQIQNSGAAGAFDLVLDRNDLRPLLGGVLPPFGESVGFQAWFRDAGSSNMTDAVTLWMY